MIDQAGYQLKKEALALAETYVEPLVEKFPPEKYTLHYGPSTIISSNGNTVIGPAEQAVDLMIKLASWLVQDESND